MLGFLCARRKTWIVSSLSSFAHGPAAIHQSRIFQNPLIQHQLANFSGEAPRRHHHNSACQLGSACGGGAAASIWHAILPSSGLWRRRDLRRPAIHYELKGEGSWNAALDARPARWLHRPDSAWLLFGVCNCLAPIDWGITTTNATNDEESNNKTEPCDSKSLITSSDENLESSADYRVTGYLMNFYDHVFNVNQYEFDQNIGFSVWKSILLYQILAFNFLIKLIMFYLDSPLRLVYWEMICVLFYLVKLVQWNLQFLSFSFWVLFFNDSVCLKKNKW